MPKIFNCRRIGEIKAQFEMISLLKEKKLTSKFKHSLRK